MGFITKIFAWTTHPSIETEKSPKEWMYGLIVILLLAFLWSRVVNQIIEGA